MKRYPSRWWHVLSAVIFLGCAVCAPIAIIVLMIRQFPVGEEFLVPGTHSMNLKKPGRYIVWNVVSGFHAGTQYGFPDNLPSGTHIRIVDDVAGKEIPTRAELNSSETSGTSKRLSVCSFHIQAPGPCSLIVDGTSEQRLLMVRRSVAAKVAGLFLICGLVSSLGWILAPLMSIVVEVRRSHATQESAGQAAEAAVDGRTGDKCERG